MQKTGYSSTHLEGKDLIDEDNKPAQENSTEETSEPPLGTEKPVQEDVGPGEPGDKEEEVTGKHATQEMVSGDFHHMVQPAQITENPKVIGQDNAEQGTEGAAEKPVQESEAGAKPGEKPVQESEAGAKPGEKPFQESEAGAKPSEKPVQESEAGAKPGEKPVQESEAGAKPGEKPDQESEADAKPGEKPVQESEAGAKPGEKPVQESEAGAKPVEMPVQESEDVGKKPRPEAICAEESDLQLKEGPTIMDPVQETENPTVGSVEKSERENKSVEESGKEGRMSQPVQEVKNPNVSSMEKSKPETDIVEESNQQGNLADSKMPEPVQETVNPALGNAEKGELENKGAEESGKQGRGGESDSQGNVAGPMPSNFEMAEPIQASENSAEFNETEHETTHEQGGHQVVDDRQNGDSSRDFPGQDFTPEDYSIFGIPLDWGNYFRGVLFKP